MTLADRFVLALAVADSTLAALCQGAGCTQATGAAIVCRLRRAKRVHVAKWLMADPAGGRLYPRPVYSLGGADDAPKPERKPRDRNRHRPVTRVPSVFHLGGLL